ncbi:HAD family phosphatase [Mariniblastus sp.]|nr:HAD family phosphatase [Mariniblastus sp.]
MKNKPLIAAVAFDMDGLIFNTEDLYDQVGEILLSRRGLKFTRKLKMEMMGLPAPTAYEIMRKRCAITDSVGQLQTETDEIFDELLPEQLRTMPGLETLLEKLESKRIPKIVATSSHRKFANRNLAQFELTHRFEFILTAEDVTQGKPHPEIYLTASEKLAVPPINLLVLEDSKTGSTAAAASGAFTIAVPTDHSVGLDFSHVNHVASRLDDEFILSLFD